MIRFGVTIPAEFPSDVPRPDTFELMTFMTSDAERVGWEFYDQREPTDSVERCTGCASSFDASWTFTPKTDEHESVLYAQVLDNGQWQVGIYCINDGGYLVQVMPTNASLPLTADTLPPTVSSGPRASFDLPGWILSAEDTGDDTTIGASTSTRQSTEGPCRSTSTQERSPIAWRTSSPRMPSTW